MERFRRNLGLKVVAIVLSLITFMAVRMFAHPSSETLAQSVYTVPINFVAPPQDMVYSADYKQVTVTLRGRLAALDRIDPGMISADVDLSERKKTGNALETVNVNVPGGAQVANVDPNYVWVQVSKRQNKRVPVRVNLMGQMESGYSVGTPEVLPATIDVNGSQDAVDRVMSLRASIPVARAKRTFTTTVQNLLAIDSAGNPVRGLKWVDEDISVTIPIFSLQRVPVNVDNVTVMAPKGVHYKVSVEPVNVVFECSDSQTIPESVRTEKKIIRLGKNEESAVVPLEIPDGLNLASGISSNVVVTVRPLAFEKKEQQQKN